MKWDSVLTTTLVVCALTTTGLVVHREFFSAATRPAFSAPQKPAFIQDWKAHLTMGVMLGPSSARVQLIEFADFECPFCANFHETLKTLRERYPREVAIVFAHNPLSMHRFAEPAARAAECAAQQGRFEAMQDRLFEQQGSFGLIPWSDYAAQAGVPDADKFEACVKDTNPIPRIEAGKQLAKTLDIHGTPTVIVNGWQLPKPPSIEELNNIVRGLLSSPNASLEEKDINLALEHR